ncbi:MAG: DUF192 domain-containing protein [Pseudobdellovibrionaceae bacterium]|jgi:uncharacterized membrane protein (UPF0127 family)|nr:DUF192 domain-containing protein [Pseudobdellovibrionaceae bacterium]
MIKFYALLVITCISLATFRNAKAETIQIVDPNREGDVGISFNVELALNDEDRALGLMYRRQMDDFSGMLFVFPKNKNAAFWMKNTLIPLDMIFIDEHGIIKNIHPNAIPGDLTRVEAGQPVKAVLEISGGMAQKAGISVGNTILPKELINSLEVE